VRRSAGGGGGGLRPEYDLKVGAGWTAARRTVAVRAAFAAAVSFWVSWLVSMTPAAVTGSSLRTGATDATKVPRMPPGVQVS
jgi:hypothetical protein